MSVFQCIACYVKFICNSYSTRARAALGPRVGVVINQLMHKCAYYNYFISRKHARVAISKAAMRHIQVCSSVFFFCFFFQFLNFFVANCSYYCV